MAMHEDEKRFRVPDGNGAQVFRIPEGEGTQAFRVVDGDGALRVIVCDVMPSRVILSKDGHGNPNTERVPFIISGINLHEVDTAGIKIMDSTATIDVSVGNQPVTVGSTEIKMTLIVNDADAPVVVALPLKCSPTEFVNSLPLMVTLRDRL